MALKDTPPPSANREAGLDETIDGTREHSRRPSSPASRTEVRLRIRVAELEAQLVELAECLQGAEQRASELLSARDRIVALEAAVAEADAARREAEDKLVEIAVSRSWQMTKPLRAAMQRLRSSR